MILLPFIIATKITPVVILCAFKWHMFTCHDNKLHQEPKFAWQFIPHGVCMAYVPMSSQTVLT